MKLFCIVATWVGLRSTVTGGYSTRTTKLVCKTATFIRLVVTRNLKSSVNFAGRVKVTYRADDVTECCAEGQSDGVITHHDDVGTSSDDVIVNEQKYHRAINNG